MTYDYGGKYPELCPFCYEEGEVEEIGRDWWAVVCLECGCCGPAGETPEIAITLWDKRYKETSDEN